METNRLFGRMAYLAGAIDRVPDGGVNWRRKLTPWLNSRGVIVLDPCDKPIDIAAEDLKTKPLREQWKRNGEFLKLKRQIGDIRHVDLAMVDKADFLIVNIDMDVHHCGTYDEVFMADRNKRPIIIHIEQGKQYAPDWLFDVVPEAAYETNEETIFSSWDEVKVYLDWIDHLTAKESARVQNQGRWLFFDFKKITEAAMINC